MAVANLRVQLEFRMGADGWSELYWHAGESPKGFEASAQALVTERKKALVNDATIHHVRISAAQPGARSYRFPVPNGSGALPDTKLRDVGPVTTTVGVYTQGGAYRKLMLHGLPDSDHVFNTSGVPDVTLSPTVLTFIQYLKDAGYQIRSVGASANDPANAKVLDITVAANGIVTFEMDTAGLAVGQKVRISGAKGQKVSQFNGVWTVGVLNAGPPTSFSAVTTRLIDPNFFYSPASAVLRSAAPTSYSFNGIDSWDNFEFPGTRKTGRPTDSPRGRRSSQR